MVSQAQWTRVTGMLSLRPLACVRYGQGMMEYALLLALVSVAAIAALYLFGGGLNSLLGIGASAAPH
jgi:Flp pilus assembly pilin Flp